MGAEHYVFAGGGTGGHLFPGLAVAAALREHDAHTAITFFTTDRKLDADLLEPTDYTRIVQPVQPFTTNPLRLATFWSAWRRSVVDAERRLREHRPRAVLGLGGYAAGPPVVAAHKLGIHTTILNPDAIPGRANRFLARYADEIILQWASSREYFADTDPCVVLGCPIRPDFIGADPRAGKSRFSVDPDRPVLLVTGASQGAHSINEAVSAAWPTFHSKHSEWQLLHVTGPADEQAVRAAYKRAGAPAQVISFVREMWLALAAADLVVSRAGASTLAELAAVGRPALLMPYPYHRDRHQHANAQVFVDQGAAIVLEDRISPDRNVGPLRAALDKLGLPERRQEMAAAARELARPRAAEEIAELLRR